MNFAELKMTPNGVDVTTVLGKLPEIKFKVYIPEELNMGVLDVISILKRLRFNENGDTPTRNFNIVKQLFNVDESMVNRNEYLTIPEAVQFVMNTKFALTVVKKTSRDVILCTFSNMACRIESGKTYIKVVGNKSSVDIIEIWARNMKVRYCRESKTDLVIYHNNQFKMIVDNTEVNVYKIIENVVESNIKY